MSDSITRYTLCKPLGSELWEELGERKDDQGEWVKHSDHEAALAAKDAEIKALAAEREAYVVFVGYNYEGEEVAGIFDNEHAALALKERCEKSTNTYDSVFVARYPIPFSAEHLI